MLINIQILRAYAAIAVAFFHINMPGLSSGSFGVHVFFVISGFIIAHSFVVQPDRFFLRRIIRIVPAYWACTIGIFCIALIRPEWLNSTTANTGKLLKSLLFIPYLKENGLMQPVLNVGWTLNYEMFFYLAVSISLWIAGNRYAVALTCVMLAVILRTLPGLCASDVCSFYANPISYEFCYGMIAYYLWRKRWLERIPRQMWMVSCLLFALALPLIEARIELPFSFGTASAGLVFSAAMLERPFSSVWKKRFVAIGDASYLIYLIHMYVIELFNKIAIPIFPVLTLNALFGVSLCLGIIIAVSIVLHRFLEKPLLDWLKEKLVPRRQHIPAALAASGGC